MILRYQGVCRPQEFFAGKLVSENWHLIVGKLTDVRPEEPLPSRYEAAHLDLCRSGEW